LSHDGIKSYSANLEGFKAFFQDPVSVNAFAVKADVNPDKPVSKIDKKTIEANIIVQISIDKLRDDLIQRSLIKSMVSFSFTPSILIVPSDEWMNKNGYVKTQDNMGMSVFIYDYERAIVTLPKSWTKG